MTSLKPLRKLSKEKMLVNCKKILEKADQEHFAIGGFNITSLETALGIVQAAEELTSPIILQISEKTIDYMSLEVVTSLARTLADRSTVPVAVHFDHGRNYDLVTKSIEMGFTSVMLDVSKMPEKERIPFVKSYVQSAKKRNVTVEVEEDVIGGREDYVDGKGWKFTDPKRAAVFVQETGCDMFAISIGNSHGKALPDETFDIDLISEINSRVSVPLVLHGASSTPDKLIREAISRGVCKINIDTDLRLAVNTAIRDTLKNEELYDPRDILKSSITAVKELVAEKIRLFGSEGKA